MYPQVNLGKFIVPEGADGLLQVRYEPESLPTVMRGSVNPWADEQARSLRVQEDQAWMSIHSLTRQIRSIESQIAGQIAYYNRTLAELEHHLDRKIGGQINLKLPLPGVAPITSTGQLAMSIVFPAFLLPGFDFIGKMIGGFFGIGKKAKPVMAYVNMLIGQMQSAQENIQKLTADYAVQVDQLRGVVQTATGIKAALEQLKQSNLQQAAMSASYKEANELQQGKDLAARNRQVALLHLTRQGGSDAL